MKLNPRVDYAFKLIFGAPKNKDLLIALINAIVDEKDRVQDVQLLNPFNDKTHQYGKLSIMDIKATDEQGRQYNIEMQIHAEVAYDKRVLYYWSRLYADQLKEGASFKTLQKTISINLLNFNKFEGKAYHHVFRVLNIKTYETLLEELELHFIELDKFDKDLAHIKTAIDRWIQFLKHPEAYHDKRLPDALKKDKVLNKAVRVLETFSLSEEERTIYEDHLKWMRDQHEVIDDIRVELEAVGFEKGEAVGLKKGEAVGLKKGEAKGFEKGEAAGLKKGEVKGFEKGEAAGLKKGEAKGFKAGEQEERRSVAKKLLRQGISVDVIMHATGLSKHELACLEVQNDD